MIENACRLDDEIFLRGAVGRVAGEYEAHSRLVVDFRSLLSASDWLGLPLGELEDIAELLRILGRAVVAPDRYETCLEQVVAVGALLWNLDCHVRSHSHASGNAFLYGESQHTCQQNAAKHQESEKSGP